MAFLATKPKSIIIPNIENRLMVFNVSASTKIAPMIATGSENKTTKGYTTLSYKATITKYINIIANPTARNKLANAVF